MNGVKASVYFIRSRTFRGKKASCKDEDVVIKTLSVFSVQDPQSELLSSQLVMPSLHHKHYFVPHPTTKKK